MKKIISKILLLLIIFVSLGICNIKADEVNETEIKETISAPSNEESNTFNDKQDETNTDQEDKEKNVQQDENHENETQGEKEESQNEEDIEKGATSSNENEQEDESTKADENLQENEIEVTKTKATASENDDSSSDDEKAADGGSGDTPTEEEATDDIQNHKVKVIIEKKDEDGRLLEGAELQLKNSKGDIIKTWVSSDAPLIIYLEDGKYTVHEVSAPEGYNIAEDKEFEVKVVIPDVDAGVDFSSKPCPHYYGTPMYYVEIEGKKNEVYCINQNWETPDGNSDYYGGIISPDNIREFTKQTNPIGIDENDVKKAILSNGPMDVSEQSLNNQELYDKILNIIYHRQIAASVLSNQGLSYSVEEIRYITEVALKNYTNPGLAEVQYNKNATDSLLAKLDAAGVVYRIYYDHGVKKVSYLKHNYRDFVYTPDVPLGTDITITDFGNGNSFAQMVAGHFNSFSSKDYLHPDVTYATQAHDAKHKPAEREQVARYYELFKFLISDENPHPEDMQLFIYSSDTVATDVSSNNHDGGKYQHLLGVTGYVETEYEQEPVEVEIINTYKVEKKDISVIKIWEDKSNHNKVRPKTVTVNLKADGKTIATVTLSAKNGWKHTFKNLDVYKEGRKINYTLTENRVKKYTTQIKGDAVTGFRVVNTYYGDEKNPLTADNVYIYISLVVVSLVGLIRFSYILFKNKNL